jgi:hypothetical protein
MPIDYARTRADTGRLEESIDSSGVNATQTRLTQSVMQNFQESIGGGLREFGRGIASGLDKRFEETRDSKALERATRAAALGAQAQDLSERERARELFRGSRVDTVENTVSPGRTLDRDALAASLFKESYGDALGDWKDLSDEMKRPVRQIVDMGLGEQVRIHQGGPDVARQVGKYAEGLGFDQSEVGTYALAQARDAVRALAHSDRAFSKGLIEGTETQEAIKRAQKDRNPELAQAYKAFRNNPRLRAAAEMLAPYWDAGGVQEFSTPTGQKFRGTFRRYAMKFGSDLASIVRNMTMGPRAVPRLAIHRAAGGKEMIESIYTGDLLSRTDGSKKKVMSQFVGKDVFEAHAGETAWDTTDQILKRLEDGSWAEGAKSKNVESVKKTLQAQLATMDRDQVRGIIATQLGWMSVPDNFFAANAALAGQSGAQFSKTLRGLANLAPELRQWVTAPHSETEPTTEAQKLFDQTYEAGIEPGAIDYRPGPLAFLKDAGIGAGEAAVIFNEFVKSSTQSPEYQGLQALLLQGGMDKKEAVQLAREVHPALMETLGALRSGFISDNGKTFDELPVGDQNAIQLDQAQGLVDGILDARGLRKGVESKSTFAGVAGTSSFVTTFDARKLARQTIQAQPQYAEGTAEIQVPGTEDRIILQDGKPHSLLSKNEKGEMVPKRFPDQVYDTSAVDEAFKVSREVYDSYSATQAQRAQRALQIASEGTGDPVIDNLLQMQVGVGGTRASLYKWLDMQMSNPAGATKDPALALTAGLAKYGAENGVDFFELRDRFAAAANRSQDPVIDAVAVFLGEHTSPNKTKHADIAPGGAVPGTDPDLKRLGNQAYQEERSKETGQQGSKLDALKQAHAAAAAEPVPPSSYPTAGSANLQELNPLFGTIMGDFGLKGVKDFAEGATKNLAAGAASLGTGLEAAWQSAHRHIFENWQGGDPKVAPGQYEGSFKKRMKSAGLVK